MFQAAQNAIIDPIVRVRKSDMPQIQRRLDIGSRGVSWYTRGSETMPSIACRTCLMRSVKAE